MEDGIEVMQIEGRCTHEWLLNKHYAHRIPSISFAFGLYENSILIGVCTFGRTAFNEPSLLCGDKYKTLVYELNRLCVDSDIKNITSWFVSRTLKLLPKPLILISYADSGENHYGYIYQATNWLYTGEGTGSVNYITSDGKLSRAGMRNREKRGTKFEIISIEKGTKKYRYVYFIGNKKEKKEMREALKYKELPYPKGESKRYDASYTPTQQIKPLFNIMGG